jgi:hypothetical protein
MPRLTPRSKVTVIDDDELALEDVMDGLRDCDFEPMTLTQQYGNELDRMVREIQEQGPDFVICDHKLQPGGLASFFGLDVVRKLLAVKRPAMLLTMYQQTDRMRMKLRESRHLLPVIASRDDFEPEGVVRYAEICIRELENDPVEERRAHRTLIRVDWADPENGNEKIDVVISGWSPDHAITVPAACIHPDILPRIRTGQYLLGDINIGAEQEDDLFFTAIDQIVEPTDVEGLT